MLLRDSIALTAFAALTCVAAAQAATPASGGVDGNSTQTSWSGDTRAPTGSAECAGPSDPACDNYTLTVGDPGVPFRVTIALDPGVASDWDTELYDSSGALVDSSGNGPGSPETMELSSPGTYTVAAAPFAPNPLQAYSATASLALIAVTPPPPPSDEAAPRFLTYAPPGITEADPDFQRFAPTRGDAGLGTSAGEPTLGIPAARNRATQTTTPNLSRVMYLANLQTLRLEVDTSTSPAIGTWRDKSCDQHLTTLDPILQVDPETGRTISTQLNAKRSLICLSSDDGDSWIASPQGAGINAGVDHQTIGTGHFPAGDTLRQPDPLDPLVDYANATYYASQDAAIAQAALSRDGGFTWGVSSPMYNITQCGGLHGHLQVGVDGTVYVPNGNCPLGQVGLARSTDAGLSWTVHGIPDSVSDDDPGIGVGRGDEVAGGRVFFGACQNGKPMTTVSSDRGETWSALADVSGSTGIQNCAFPTMVAGDDDRAAFAFLGTTTPGAAAYGSDPDAFDGVWHLYVSVTYDGGLSWVTTNASPGDPVQRGPICMRGTLCEGYRNLLDFNDIQLDEIGRIYVAYADGCVGNCISAGPNSMSDFARIARQEEGTKGLLAAFDPVLAPSASAPRTPYAEATRVSPTLATLRWARPFDGNSAITGYRVLRRVAGTGTPAPIASVGSATLGYSDASVLAGVDYCYQVQAINAVGSSQGSFEACATAPVVLGNACVAPGLQLGEDRSGELADSTPLGLRRLFGGEPFLATGAACDTPAPSKVEFNLDTGAKLVAGNAVLLIWNRQTGVVPSQIALAQPDDRNMVSVRMVGASPQCRFGHVTGTSLTAPLPTHGYDISAPFAAADCVVRDDGSITVRVPTEVIDDGSVGPGYSFGGLEARSFAAQPVATASNPMPVLQTSAADFLVATSFSLVGNEACRPDFEPQAIGDRITSNFRDPVTFDALANDSTGGDCDTLRIVSVSRGAFGDTRIEANGQITYTPRKRNRCNDEFSYTIDDGNGNRDSAVVTVRGTAARCSNH